MVSFSYLLVSCNIAISCVSFSIDFDVWSDVDSKHMFKKFLPFFPSKYVVTDTYIKVLAQLDMDEKLIIFYGPSGVGKTFTLQALYYHFKVHNTSKTPIIVSVASMKKPQQQCSYLPGK